MEVIRRCYGCGRYIWLWQDAIVTQKAGRIHDTRDCILDSYYKLLAADAKPSPLYEAALAHLVKIDKSGIE